MPTLLSVNNYYYARGGAEVVFLEHNRMFEASGWRVVPFSMLHPKNLATPWSRHFIDELELGASYTLLEKLVRASKVIYSFEARRKLSSLIDLVKPDICHGHNIYHHLSPSILGLLKQRGIPTILTLHDLKLACPAYSMLTSDGICERCRGGRLHNVVTHRCMKGSVLMSGVVYAEALLHGLLKSYRRNVNFFAVPSRFYIEKFAEWGMPRTLFRHIPNFVDVERHRPRYQPGREFVYVGRLSREKGLMTLIRAAAAAQQPVRIVGIGPQQQELQQLATSLRADVQFSGYLTGESLHDVVRGARAVVLPSEWYENAPLSVLEAYALGKPVVGARIGGIPELIREQQTGLSFTSGDPEALSAALLQVAGMPDAAVEAMGRYGRQWMEAEFTAAHYRQRVLGLYGELGVSGAMIAAGSSL